MAKTTKKKKRARSGAAFRKAKKNAGGRPTKLNQKLTDELCKLIMQGSYVETAVAYCGISKETFYAWMKDGANKKSAETIEFSDAVRKATAQSELRDVLLIDRLAHGNDEKGIKPDLRALTWRMERKYPKRWGRKEILKLEDNDTKNSAFQDNDQFQEALLDFIEEQEKKTEGE